MAKSLASHNLGFPRIGARRELKKATEAYWSGKISADELQTVARDLRARHWSLQQEAGITGIPSNDFSFYDQVLDTCAMVGAVPERYQWDGQQVELDTFFAMARGAQTDSGTDVIAMEMTKWFDTNYHYIVPEFTSGQQFTLTSRKPIEEFNEAKTLGIQTRPVLIGPVSFLLLGKAKDEGVSPITLLPQLLPVYEQVLSELAAAGADWVQFDEPCLVMDRSAEELQAFQEAYTRLSQASPQLKILLATYFGDLGDNLEQVVNLPVDALHVDLVRGRQQLDQLLTSIPETLCVSLGLIDGRNIWKTDLRVALDVVQRVVEVLGEERVMVGPSCSLMFVPNDLDMEELLNPEIKDWLAFAKQKLDEIATLAEAGAQVTDAVQATLDANGKSLAARASSPLIHRPDVAERLSAVTEADMRRQSVFRDRRERQQQNLQLPPFPTTTIGSFPQTKEIRAARRAFKNGELDRDTYVESMRSDIRDAVERQQALGLDVLVHGEPERNDMVEYFGEQLEGFIFTQHGWVQSYGSRYVKPPIVFGDVSRPEPMTVEWATYAQSLTSKPMKGMLTGPITILQWSFVRDDQPRSTTARQIALAILDEVVDLEAAGIQVIQIDEPAIREGLPLRRADWSAYLDWAVQAFRLASSGVRDETQIHTHMCYSEFNDIIEAIAAMDADVITIETSRSQMELLEAFREFQYPNDIGPGVYDIHSPRVPSQEEIELLLDKASEVLPVEQIWVNPDCGLKTRKWPEVTESLEHMVAAAGKLREKVAAART